MAAIVGMAYTTGAPTTHARAHFHGSCCTLRSPANVFLHLCPGVHSPLSLALCSLLLSLQLVCGPERDLHTLKVHADFHLLNLLAQCLPKAVCARVAGMSVLTPLTPQDSHGGDTSVGLCDPHVLCVPAHPLNATTERKTPRAALQLQRSVFQPLVFALCLRSRGSHRARPCVRVRACVVH